MCCPEVCGCGRWLADACAEYALKFLSGWPGGPERSRDPLPGGLLLPDDALGVDLVQHTDAVPCPLGYLRRWHTGVEPRRDGGMPRS